MKNIGKRTGKCKAEKKHKKLKIKVFFNNK